MQIQARTNTPTEFVIYAGSGKERLVKPTRRTSFHLMVTLLISPPVAGRYLEYRHVWLKPHRVRVAFNWKPTR
jgi:hypothetical protein